MTSKEVIDFLEKQGYRSYPVSRFEGEGILWTGSKRLPEKIPFWIDPVPECDCNGNKISWHIKVWEFKLPNDFYNRQVKSVDIEIVAEKHKQWFKLNSYGISFEELKDQLPVAQNCLLNAWIACARSTKCPR